MISPPVRSRDFVETVRLHKVDVLVLSSNLDEEPMRGFELLRQLRAADPGALAIMLLDSSKRETVLQAFRAGARGIFSRHDSLETLSKCIRSVREGQIWANSEQMTFAVEALATSPTLRAVDANGLSLLSKREMDVVRSLAEGLTNREIAERSGTEPAHHQELSFPCVRQAWGIEPSGTSIHDSDSGGRTSRERTEAGGVTYQGKRKSGEVCKCGKNPPFAGDQDF